MEGDGVMATLSVKIDEQTVTLHTDKIVRRLDDFPELVRALRDGDLLTGRSFCARLFDGDARRNHLGELTPALQAAMKAL
jgi:hypothetical protein